MRCTYFENVLCKTWVLLCCDVLLLVWKSLIKNWQVGWRVGQQLGCRLSGRWGKASCVGTQDLPEFLLVPILEPIWMVICGYASLCYSCLPSAVGFGDGQPPCSSLYSGNYHMLVFLVFTPLLKMLIGYFLEQEVHSRCKQPCWRKLYQIESFSIYRLDCSGIISSFLLYQDNSSHI